MSHPPTSFSTARYLRFLSAVAVAVAVLAAIGYFTSAGRGDSSLEAMLAALAATGLASAVSGIPLALVGGPPHASFNRSLIAMLVRMVVVAALAAACLLSLGLAQTPFLVWLVIGYLALLAVDTAFAVRFFRRL